MLQTRRLTIYRAAIVLGNDIVRDGVLTLTSAARGAVSARAAGAWPAPPACAAAGLCDGPPPLLPYMGHSHFKYLEETTVTLYLHKVESLLMTGLRV